MIYALFLLACGQPAAEAPAPEPPPPAATALEAVPFALPAGAAAEAPHLTTTEDGLLLSWWEPGEEGSALRAARITADGVEEPVTVRTVPDALVNWADVPTVSATPRGWLASWPGRAEGHAYDLMLAMSPDGGAWTELGPAHDDGTKSEHGFASVAAGAERTWLFWLDGRETATGGAMTLRAATVGAHVEPSAVVDPRVCDCCGTDAVLTAAGPVVAYRDRSEAEVRDIRVARQVDGAWQSVLVEDGWTIEGCPVNGPALDTHGEELALAWYTEADGPAVRLATGTAAALGEPVAIAAGEAVLGRVDVAHTAAGAVVSWLEAEGEQARVRARVAGTDTFVDVGTTASGRRSGFPVVGELDGVLLWVWTVPGEGLQAATVGLSQLEAQ